MRQVLRAGALGRPRGMGWGVRWEGASGWGTHVNPWLIHVNVWQKPLQYCKVISLQLIKINGKKKYKEQLYRTRPLYPDIFLTLISRSQSSDFPWMSACVDFVLMHCDHVSKPFSLPLSTPLQGRHIYSRTLFYPPTLQSPVVCSELKRD